jgi:hypothetical protein
LSYTGEPAAHVLCHCLDCRKISGSSYSNNLVVPETNFKLESGIPITLLPTFALLILHGLGTPKTISKTADTGKKITSHFCPDCGTTLFRTGESFPNAYIIKIGVMDDPKWPNENVPKGELFAPERINWVAPIEGAAQMDGMPPA